MKRPVLISACALAATASLACVWWVVEPGVMAWRLRSETYVATMKYCYGQERSDGQNAEEAMQICRAQVRP